MEVEPQNYFLYIVLACFCCAAMGPMAVGMAGQARRTYVVCRGRAATAGLRGIALCIRDNFAPYAMKYLTVLAVLAVAFWIWRSNRVGGAAKRPSNVEKSAPSDATPKPMLQCTVCGVHLPATDAIAGKQGSYCSSAHRKQLEG
jgi:uncharacterized protein